MKKIIFIAILALLAGGASIPFAQDAIKSVIVQSKCVGCGDCIRACPVKAITMQRGKAVIDPEKCVGCRLCVITCSYGAPR